MVVHEFTGELGLVLESLVLDVTEEGLVFERSKLEYFGVLHSLGRAYVELEL
jgi:hypothetical protein